MRKASGLKAFVLVAFIAILVIAYYYQISNRVVESKAEEQSISEVQEILLQDLDSNYPPSPKELVKYYASITKCFYDGNYTEEEFSLLAKKSRELFDTELIGNQSEEDYLADLKSDIENYKIQAMTVSSYSVSASADVEYSTTDKQELASLYCMFTLRQESKLLTTREKFILRKDKYGHWKILGWTLDEEMGNE